MSNWKEEGQYKIPETYEVKILPAGQSKWKTLQLKTGDVNFISASDLGFGTKLLDGVYCFEAQSCENIYKRTRAFLPNLECCLSSAYATLPERDFDKLREIRDYIVAIKTNAEIQKVKKADSILKVAKILMDNLKCDCNC